jgi:alkanesulfonate monooxygenase SsuD/methylene tetrahydromethanopterin reductase-like flavin-dependent oxidoreductase (luciferase family)
LAKSVASLGQIFGGRFLFGIGSEWNQDEIENHGTAFAEGHEAGWCASGWKQ